MAGDDAPILEFDPSPTAVIEPTGQIDPTDIPRRAVLCFFQDVIAQAVDEFDGREIDEVRSEIGLVPVHELRIDGSRLAVVHPGVGAPLAAAFLEELIARGVAAVVACGGAGVLVPDVALSAGSNTFTATIVGPTDLESEASAAVSYVLDTSKPRITVSSPKANEDPMASPSPRLWIPIPTATSIASERPPTVPPEPLAENRRETRTSPR